MNELRFDDDVAIVTGAGRGLGREHALAFARRGAAVLVNDVDADAAADTVTAIVEVGGRASASSDSIVDAAGAAAVRAAALAAFGKVTILVNNAGIIDYSLFGDIDDAAWRRMQAVTLDGAFFMTRALWPDFLAQGHGRVINTTSNVGFAGNEQLVHYGAAKLGVAGLTKALAQEAKGTGLTVNAIAPMAVTRMNRDAFFGGENPDSDDWQADIRAGRVPIGPASIVSPTVLWLAHRSTDINGEIFSTSSGRVGRVGFVIGRGYFNPDHTPEDLAANNAIVRSLDDALDPSCAVDEIMLIPSLFAQR